MEAKEKAREVATEVLNMISDILVNEIGGSLTEDLDGKLKPIVPLIERHICAARREAMKECLEEVVNTQRGLTSERYFAGAAVSGAENRIRVLITKEA